MKNSYLGAAMLACALGLSACGGSSGELLLGGQVFGVTKDGLVLQNNGGSDLNIPANASTFYFKDLIGVDSTYNVTVKSIPDNATKCEVANATGRSAFNVQNVYVTCTLKTHALGGSITGLGNATGLVLVNGSNRVDVPAGATSFSMAAVGEDSPYGITILTQPAGKSCTITNNVGTMLKADITNVAVNCVNAG
ncbi:MAG TPA: hypothetical protein VNT33_13645 [Telluria sp.]|nr:hypothetical protein [Telluria sp.]